MRRKNPIHWGLILFLALVITACGSSGDGANDGGTDAAVDAGQDAGGDAASGTDADLTQNFLVHVPAGTELCGGFGEGRGWELEMAMLGRIALVPGDYVLPRQAGVTYLEMVDSLRMGPEAEMLMVTAAAGELEAKQLSDSRWTYTYTKDFFWNTEPVQLELTFSLGQVDQAWPGELTLPHLSWEQVVTARIHINGLTDPSNSQAFALCDLGDSGTEVYRGTIADNSRSFRITLQQGPWYDSCFCAGETACMFFIEAELDAGDFHQTVIDRFRLVYAGNHHNWFDEHLVLLDPPKDNEAAWLIIEPDFSGDPGQLVIMNGAFEELESHEIITWTRE